MTKTAVYSLAGRQASVQGMEALVVGVFYEDNCDQVVVLGLNESVREVLQDRGETRNYVEVRLGTTRREFPDGESFDTLMDGYRRSVTVPSR